jgi:hypothetical protein
MSTYGLNVIPMYTHSSANPQWKSDTWNEKESPQRWQALGICFKANENDYIYFSENQFETFTPELRSATYMYLLLG